MLNESSSQMKKVFIIVQEIAAQTKLLSINAAIEAARAGEHGRGFSVVAGEIQKLADGTRKALEQVTQLVTRSTEHTEAVVESIREAQRLIADGRQRSDETTTVFQRIVHSMESNIREITQMGTNVKSLVGIIEEIGSATHKVAASAEQLNERARSL